MNAVWIIHCAKTNQVVGAVESVEGVTEEQVLKGYAHRAGMGEENAHLYKANWCPIVFWESIVRSYQPC
jgi:hypothetical protein